MQRASVALTGHSQNCPESSVSRVKEVARERSRPSNFLSFRYSGCITNNRGTMCGSALSTTFEKTYSRLHGGLTSWRRSIQWAGIANTAVNSCLSGSGWAPSIARIVAARWQRGNGEMHIKFKHKVFQGLFPKKCMPKPHYCPNSNGRATVSCIYYRETKSVKRLALIMFGALTACTTNSTEPPTVPFQGNPVEFPVRFIGFADGFSPTCSYAMGAQKGTFRVPANINFKFTDEKQTLNLKCTVDETKKIPRNVRKIKAFHWEGSWSWSADTTFKRHTSYYATGKIGDRRRVRVPASQGEHELRASLIESKGVQILPNLIVVTPEPGSLEMTPLY